MRMEAQWLTFRTVTAAASPTCRWEKKQMMPVNNSVLTFVGKASQRITVFRPDSAGYLSEPQHDRAIRRGPYSAKYSSRR